MSSARRLLLAWAVFTVSVAAALLAWGSAGVRPALAAETAGAAAGLPRGGTSVLPERRVVALYGAPQADQLGILGIGPPSRAARRLRKRAREYRRPGRPVLPAFELVATVAQASPGKDGLYRARQSRRTIRRYLREARRNDFLLLLDVQPGRSDFVSEMLALKPFLREPDVGLALDPEWRMHHGQVPGQSIGHVTAGEVNRVTARLDSVVERLGLPQKLVLIHQFTPRMIRDRAKLRDRPGIDMVLNADGFGTARQKRARYHELAPRGKPFFRGFKLFLQEDTGLMKPGQVLRLRPRPVDVVIYE